MKEFDVKGSLINEWRSPSVCLSPTSTLNMHSAEGATVSHDVTVYCCGCWHIVSAHQGDAVVINIPKLQWTMNCSKSVHTTVCIEVHPSHTAENILSRKACLLLCLRFLIRSRLQMMTQQSRRSGDLGKSLEDVAVELTVCERAVGLRHRAAFNWCDVTRQTWTYHTDTNVSLWPTCCLL